MLRLSVVIPVRADQRIFALVHGLSHQTDIEHCEVIVACDGAPRSIVARLAQAQKHVSQLRVLELDPAGPASAINAGIRAARAERIVILDSDCAIEQGYLSALLQVPDDTVAARGPIHFVGKTPLARLTACYRAAIYETVVVEGRLYTPNILISRQLFFRLGMFRSDVVHSYDSEFSDRAARAGVRATLVRDAHVWHDCHAQLAGEIPVWWHYGQGRHLRHCEATSGPLQRFWFAVFGDIQWRTALVSAAQLTYVIAYVLVRAAGYTAAAAQTRVGRRPATSHGMFEDGSTRP